MAELVEEEQSRVARRIFLLDNSGSTGAGDGHMLVPTDSKKGYREQPCSRWDEISHMAHEQAQWNLVLNVPCEFVLLNPYGSSAVDGVGFVVVDQDLGAGDRQLAHLDEFLRKNGPKGVTPLAQRLGEITERIRSERTELQQNQQRVCLVIATDGMPTSDCSGQTTEQDKRNFVRALRHLSALDVHIVLRLCTDDDAVVEYYGQIDNELEIELEVLDDIESEARELVQEGNGWVTYSPLLHRIREMGSFWKLLDLMDERKLTPAEIYQFAKLLLKQGPQDPPLPTEPAEFYAAVQRRLPSLPLVYNPLTKRLDPPVDLYRLRVALGLGPRWMQCIGAEGCAVQ